MTPQPDKEYIITEEQAQRLELCHRDIATNGGVNDAWCIMNEIRSRPAPTPDVDCTTCKWGDQCRPLAYIPPCYNHGPDSPERAAAQAREDALEKGIAVIKNRIDCIMISYEGEENEAITQRPYAMSDGMQECILMLESLRTGGEP